HSTTELLPRKGWLIYLAESGLSSGPPRQIGRATDLRSQPSGYIGSAAVQSVYHPRALGCRANHGSGLTSQKRQPLAMPSQRGAWVQRSRDAWQWSLRARPPCSALL